MNSDQYTDAKATQSEFAWLEWAKEHGSDDLKWAIANDYPIGDAIQKAAIEAMPERIGNGVKRINLFSVKGDRPVPNAAARELLDATVDLTDRLMSTESVPPCRLEVSRIKRIELPGTVTMHRTGVVITLRAAHLKHPVRVAYLVVE